ncbi:MAG: hypothetical protein ABSH34_35860 [Verrucomicrobiota bacterium]|jgi:hypothetical protein
MGILPSAMTGQFSFLFVLAAVAAASALFNFDPVKGSALGNESAARPRPAIEEVVQAPLIQCRDGQRMPAQEYVVYLPQRGEVTVDLSGPKKPLSVEWIGAVDGTSTNGDFVSGGEKRSLKSPFEGGSVLYLKSVPGSSALREENFDHEPVHWEGINNRGSSFKPKMVTQNFGYSSASQHAGRKPGEVGGIINPAAEPAYYGYRFPKPLTLSDSLNASGKLFVAHGSGHFLLGFFNADALNEWRTPNTLAARINGRGEGFHCHLEYCTSRWRAGAGLIGDIVPGRRINAKLMPADRVYDWRLAYAPDASAGSGLLTFSLGNERGTCTVTEEHRADGAAFTHFGLVPVLKSWDKPGEAWIAEVTVNGQPFDFNQDPGWEGVGNRRTYETKNTRPHFDFGWSPTRWAGGRAAGELGGLIFRGDCRNPNRLAAYGDRLSPLDLNTPLVARGKVSMIRGVSDSTASIGFYHSRWSLRSNPAQDRATPMDYLGINIEGPSAEGFFFYPVYRVHGNGAKTQLASFGPRLRIYPDRSRHDWSLYYDPQGANGKGRITVSLDSQICTLDLEAADRATGASFNRFGICTPWIDGNSVTVFFDDLQYTAGQPAQ